MEANRRSLRRQCLSQHWWADLEEVLRTLDGWRADYNNVSPHSRLANQPPDRHPPPRCLGVDDWAWRKAQRYGTLLCDLESGRIVDLLPERTAESLAQWLRDHPGVEVISRDRAGTYADGARQGAPEAVQVADRFHLFRNLTDALQRILEREHARLRRAQKRASAPPSIPPAAPAEPKLSAAERRKQDNRARRLARYEEATGLEGLGLSQVEIARRTGVERRTLSRWFHQGSFPERKQSAPRTRRSTAAYSYLEQRWKEGATTRRSSSGRSRPRASTAATWPCETWCRAGERGATARVRDSAGLRTPECVAAHALGRGAYPGAERYLEALTEVWPEVRELERHAREFIRFFREKDASTIGTWIREAEQTPLRRFALGLFSDLRAIRAAIELPWSNGPTEGHINRLKTLKRPCTAAPTSISCGHASSPPREPALGWNGATSPTSREIQNLTPGYIPAGYRRHSTLLGGLSAEGLCACMPREAAVDTRVCLAFVREVLVPELRPVQVVVLDNLSWHIVTQIEPRMSAPPPSTVFTRSGPDRALLEQAQRAAPRVRSTHERGTGESTDGRDREDHGRRCPGLVRPLRLSRPSTVGGEPL